MSESPSSFRSEEDDRSQSDEGLQIETPNLEQEVHEIRITATYGPCQQASGSRVKEIEAMGLLRDGLIENAKTFETQSISITDKITGQTIHEDHSVQSFAARLTPKGRDFIEVWKSNSENLLDAL